MAQVKCTFHLMSVGHLPTWAICMDNPLMVEETDADCCSVIQNAKMAQMIDDGRKKQHRKQHKQRNGKEQTRPVEVKSLISFVFRFGLRQRTR